MLPPIAIVGFVDAAYRSALAVGWASMI